MISIEVAKYLVTFDGGWIIVKGDDLVKDGILIIAKKIQEKMSCTPVKDDPDYNAGKKMAELLGGFILTYEPPTGEDRIY